MSSRYNSKSSNSKPQRFQGTLTVDPKLMGALIGRGGCNIRRICGHCGYGTYIKGESDGKTFTISSYNQDKVILAAEMIKKDEAALVDPTKRSSKPFTTLSIEDEFVPHIVGRGGSGLDQIMNSIGDGCFIIHRDGEFHISANSTADLDKALAAIRRVKSEYIQWCERQTNPDYERDVSPAPQPRKTPQKAQPMTATRGAFAALAEDSDSESDEEETYEAVGTKTDTFYKMLMQQEGLGDSTSFSRADVRAFAQKLEEKKVKTSRVSSQMFPQLPGRPNITLQVTEKQPALGAWGGDSNALQQKMTEIAEKPSVNLAPKKQPTQTAKPKTSNGSTLVDLSSFLKKYEGVSWADMCDSDDDEE
jgi:hypothetical protein